MDPSKYKRTITSRGITYNYWAVAAQPSKPTLLFCHGFPSTSKHWAYQAAHFAQRGYGVIVPDMLGYAGTDRPTDPAAYVQSKVTKDLVDILDAENVAQAVAIGHDWGSLAVSRLANYFPDRFQAYAFVSAPYIAPGFASDFDGLLKYTKELFGYEVYGYWPFFSSDDAESVILAHIDAFVAVIFPSDPETWRTNMAPLGALRESLERDFRAPLPPWMSEDDKRDFIETFTAQGCRAALRWYTVNITGLNAADDQGIPPTRALPPVTVPLFFAPTEKDFICRADMSSAVFASEAFKDHRVTIHSIDGDHWSLISHADGLTKALEEWLDAAVNTEKIQ